jgi:hypothetical protein
LLEFGRKLRRVGLRLRKITLRKNQTAQKKNKKDGKESFQLLLRNKARCAKRFSGIGSHYIDVSAHPFHVACAKLEQLQRCFVWTGGRAVPNISFNGVDLFIQRG